MNVDDVLQILEENKDERGIKYWEKSVKRDDLKTFGLGLTKLKKLAKPIGKDHGLALKLWELPYYDTKVLAALIDDPKKVSREQPEEQVKDLDYWMLTHVYCSGFLSKVSFIKELAEEWMLSENHNKRRSGWLLLQQMSKQKKYPEPYFFPYLDKIEKEIQQEENFVKDAMNVSLMYIGQKSRALNARALEVARNIGKVEVDYGDNSCVVPDCVAHLSSDRVRGKLNIGK